MMSIPSFAHVVVGDPASASPDHALAKPLPRNAFGAIMNR
jgi:hypothetical protein